MDFYINVILIENIQTLLAEEVEERVNTSISQYLRGSGELLF